MKKTLIILLLINSITSFGQETKETITEINSDSFKAEYYKIREVGEDIRHIVMISLKSEYKLNSRFYLLLTNDYQTNQLASDIETGISMIKDKARNVDLTLKRKWYIIEVRKEEDYIRLVPVDRVTGKPENYIDYGKITTSDSEKITTWLKSFKIPSCD